MPWDVFHAMVGLYVKISISFRVARVRGTRGQKWLTSLSTYFMVAHHVLGIIPSLFDHFGANSIILFRLKRVFIELETLIINQTL